MKISILCSNNKHPVYPWLQKWGSERRNQHDIDLTDSSKNLDGGDILFLISCSEIIGPDTRQKYKANLVVHASDLPKGRGWSPHIWQLLEGRNDIVVSLLEAEDNIDCGAIWKQCAIKFEGHELFDEINDMMSAVIIQLMDFAVHNFGEVRPSPQKNQEPSYYRKRTPDDSRIDPEKSIAAQFDLLRVADPDRYPAFFDFRNHRFEIRLVKTHSKDV